MASMHVAITGNPAQTCEYGINAGTHKKLYLLVAMCSSGVNWIGCTTPSYYNRKSIIQYINTKAIKFKLNTIKTVATLFSTVGYYSCQLIDENLTVQVVKHIKLNHFLRRV